MTKLNNEMYNQVIKMMGINNGAEITIKYDDKEYTGLMYGNDENFEGELLYCDLVTKESVYRCYYSSDDNLLDNGEEKELDTWDYSNPSDIKDITEEFIDRSFVPSIT